MERQRDVPRGGRVHDGGYSLLVEAEFVFDAPLDVPVGFVAEVRPRRRRSCGGDDARVGVGLPRGDGHRDVRQGEIRGEQTHIGQQHSHEGYRDPARTHGRAPNPCTR